MVRCAECGFLTLRNSETGELVELTYDYRRSGQWGSLPGCSTGVMSSRPICFIMAYDLSQEYEDAPEIYHEDGSLNRTGMNLELLQKDRQCPPIGKSYGFTEYQQGFLPKEHREMLDRIEWLKWQENQRKSDRRWRIIEIVVLGLMATIVAGGFTILGAFIERGSLFP